MCECVGVGTKDRVTERFCGIHLPMPPLWTRRGNKREGSGFGQICGIAVRRHHKREKFLCLTRQLHGNGRYQYQ